MVDEKRVLIWGKLKQFWFQIQRALCGWIPWATWSSLQDETLCIFIKWVNMVFRQVHGQE